MKYYLFLLFLISFKFADCQGLKMKLTEHTGNVESVAYSSDGKLFASGSWDGSVLLYEIDSFGNATLARTFTGHLGAVISLSFSKNTKYLVSGSKDYSVRIWNIDTPHLSKVFNLHTEPVTSAFLDVSNKFLISASLDGTIRITNLFDNKKSNLVKVGVPIYDLQVSKDNKYFYAAIKGNIVKKYETAGKNLEVETYAGHTDEVNAIELSPDGNFMATASSDKTIMIWDLSTGKSIKKLLGFEWKVTSIKYSSDGKYIVGGCNTGVAKLFEVETGKSIADFNALGKNVRDVAFSRNGKEIAVATHMDSEKFGAVIYNSGVVSGDPPQIANKKGGPVRQQGKPAATVKPGTKKPGTNGTK
jgi:WD40 repeat protein